VEDIALDGDNRIVVAGSVAQGATEDFFVARFTSDGSPDPTFGSGGQATVPMSPGSDVATGVAVQADGRIVLAGWADSGGTAAFAVSRLNVDGSLDASFGGGDGMVIDALSSNTYATDVALQPDAATTFGGAGVTLIRFERDGSLDRTFDSSSGESGPLRGIGAVPTELEVVGAALQMDGRIVMAIEMYGDMAAASLVRFEGSAPAFCDGNPVTVNLRLGESPTNGDDVILGTRGPT
jgi:uncharacterized delta-60 repeat protein